MHLDGLSFIHYKGLKSKNHMTVPINAEKKWQSNNLSLKAANKLHIGGMFLNTVKDTHNRTKVTIITAKS